MKRYNFDEIIPREGTNSIKYDARERFFEKKDILPLWVADTDFKTPDFISDAIKKKGPGTKFMATRFSPIRTMTPLKDGCSAAITGRLKKNGFRSAREWWQGLFLP